MRHILVRTALAMILVSGGAANAQSPGNSTDQKSRTLYVVGTAHLDTQWRWTIQTTIDEFIPATFRDNFALMDRYPDYVFSFEGAFRYMLLSEYYPDDYEKLRTYIDAGRWRVTGSWVDAVDVNVPSFESLVRHSLYGNGYFKRAFGRRSYDIFLPDCFGFGYALPSIATHCGIKSFSSQKLSWGSWVGIPFDIGIWEGVDGSSVIAALNPRSYGTRITGDLSRDTTWLRRIDHQGDSSGLYAAYMYFGTGDIGGSPDSTSVDWLEKSQRSDGPIRVKSIGADDLADLVERADHLRLPRYTGELLMTRHGVGCYSSQAAMKRWNRKNELLADATERACVISHVLGADRYPRDILADTWIRFLWHQFHDDLTGTSIPEAYEFSWNDEILCQNRFAGLLEHAVTATAAALDTRADGIPLVVFNPLSIDREDVVEATIAVPALSSPHVRVYGPDGDEVPSQILHTFADSVKILFTASVPSVGYAVYDVRFSTSRGEFETGLHVTAQSLENRRYQVTLADNGDVISILDKAENRELLSGPLRLLLLEDTPKVWPAWEIDYDDIMAEPAAAFEGPADIRIVEKGPVRVGLEVTRRTDRSIFRTLVTLAGGQAGDRVAFDFDVDWYERETLLKAAFPLTAAADSVTYDIGLGTIRRGLNRPELYEVPGHQWADMTLETGEYGIAVLNDCKYGWDHPDRETLRLTLIHTPGVVEDWSWVEDERTQDNGHHEFMFAVYGHRGDWRTGGVAWQAARLNQPLLAFQATAHDGELGRRYSLMKVDTQIDRPGTGTRREDFYPRAMITAVKLAEESNEVIVRLRELTGRAANSVTVSFNHQIQSVREVNGAEEHIGKAAFAGESLITSLAPYQPRAFAVTLAAGTGMGPAAPAFHRLALPFDLDGISMDGDRADGSFDSDGNTIAGEILPDSLDFHGIPFVFGPKTPGSTNALRCRGQVLSLPEGSFDRLYLVAAAADGPAGGQFVIDGREIWTWVQDYTEPVGQWNSRLAGGSFADAPADIAPAYINRAPVAWYGTHRHDSAGYNEAYRFTYLYLIGFELPVEATSVTLPSEPRIRLLAATAARSAHDEVQAACPLYDVTNTALAKLSVDSSYFTGKATVRMIGPIPGAVIRYTLDGIDPTVGSLAYSGPITVHATTTIKARAFLDGVDDSHVTTATATRLALHESEDVPDPIPGLRCHYYEGEWRKLPNFDSLPVVRQFIMDTVAIPEAARDEDYGLVFRGLVRVPRDGMYAFSSISDDGSALAIADSLVVNNDGIHGSSEIGGLIALKAGFHSLEVVMFQCKGGEDLAITIEGPGISKQHIPASMLFHRNAGD